MKNIFKMVSIFMLMLSGFAFGQNKSQEHMKQVGMEALIETSGRFYTPNAGDFILNIEKNDETKLTPYERKLMLEVHSNIRNEASFGNYTTEVLNNFKDYDRSDEAVAKVPKKTIIRIVKAIVHAMIELCEWLC